MTWCLGEEEVSEGRPIRVPWGLFTRSRIIWLIYVVDNSSSMCYSWIDECCFANGLWICFQESLLSNVPMNKMHIVCWSSWCIWTNLSNLIFTKIKHCHILVHLIKEIFRFFSCYGHLQCVIHGAIRMQYKCIKKPNIIFTKLDIFISYVSSVTSDFGSLSIFHYNIEKNWSLGEARLPVRTCSWNLNLVNTKRMLLNMKSQ